jgi:hypothetical protein
VTTSLGQIGGGESLAVLATGICACGEEKLHDLQMSPGRCELQRSRSVAVTGVGGAFFSRSKATVFT